MMVDDAKVKGVSLVKLKRKIIYAALLFTISLILLIAVTLGWFYTNHYENDVDGLSMYYPGTAFFFYQSTDTNADGIPDLDGSGNINYIPETPNRIVISNMYPQYSVSFKVNIDTTPGYYISFAMDGLSAPAASTPTVDVAKALRIKYTDPVTGQLTDKSLYEMMDASRNIHLINDYQVTGDGNFTFQYLIYMDTAADNQYRNQTLTIDKALYYATPERSASSN